jgi:hypothetical protein
MRLSAVPPKDIPMPLSHASIVATVKHQVSCDLSGEVVILNLENGVYYGLNAVGARIWQMLEEPRSVEQIHRFLLEEYDIDPHICETQLFALLHDLASSGLVEVRPDA